MTTVSPIQPIQISSVVLIMSNSKRIQSKIIRCIELSSVFHLLQSGIFPQYFLEFHDINLTIRTFTNESFQECLSFWVCLIFPHNFNCSRAYKAKISQYGGPGMVAVSSLHPHRWCTTAIVPVPLCSLWSLPGFFYGCYSSPLGNNVCFVRRYFETTYISDS